MNLTSPTQAAPDVSGRRFFVPVLAPRLEPTAMTIDLYLLKEGSRIGVSSAQFAAVEAALERLALPDAITAGVRARFVLRATFDFEPPVDLRFEPRCVGGLLVWSQLAASDDCAWRAQGDKLRPLFAECFGEAALAEALLRLAPGVESSVTDESAADSSGEETP